ncbi:MAG: NADH-quinone oxidoreductase subunit NuoH [Armatimonadetes bacterium]|nr:NADH-quinone oxidoreductase subunit NuoH [Armatimonadota bacterium]
MPLHALVASGSLWAALGEWLGGFLNLNSGRGQALGLFLGAVVALLIIMGVVTYMIWWLRKLVGWMQSRLGPMHVGTHGLLQTPADALKLLSKEGIIPTLADRAMFIVAPAIVFIAAYLAYVTIPLTPRLYIADLNVGVVFVSAVSSITVIGIVLGGWASNNKYALVSAFRSAAQVVSYEVPFALAALGPVMLAGTFSFVELVNGAQAQAGNQLLGSLGIRGAPTTFLDWFIVSQPICFLCFLIAGMAENNVTPFDIVEAESEIVAGFHIEYSGMKFALFFLAEFANTLTISILTVLLFLGGWQFPVADAALVGSMPEPLAAAFHLGIFVVKTLAVITLIFSFRAALPRVRVDQLMDLGWKVLIPITLVNLLLTGGFVTCGVPRIWLAAFNWVILGGVLWMGTRKKLGAADVTTPVIGPAPTRGPAV